MGYTPGEAHEQADLLGDTFTDEMIERIEKQLGDPERCPHGWPVNTEFEQAENRELAALSDLERRARAPRSSDWPSTTASSSTGTTTRASFPARPSSCASHSPTEGPITVELNGDERAIGERAAAGLFVRAA